MNLLIPEINVDVPIVRGTDAEALKNGVGFDPATDLPGNGGNCVIAGHRNVWGAWFWDLPRLRAGSLVIVQTPRRRYTYRVAFTRVVQPDDMSLLESARNSKDTPRLTLYTCTKPKTACRFVVVANQLSSVAITPDSTPPVWRSPVPVTTSTVMAPAQATARSAYNVTSLGSGTQALLPRF